MLLTLNLTGFRQYAIHLVKFLEKEIYGEEGIYEKHFQKKIKFTGISKQKAPLCELRKFDPMKRWWMLGEVGKQHEYLSL